VSGMAGLDKRSAEADVRRHRAAAVPWRTFTQAKASLPWSDDLKTRVFAEV
jgi:hypothetical protein